MIAFHYFIQGGVAISVGSMTVYDVSNVSVFGWDFIGEGKKLIECIGHVFVPVCVYLCSIIPAGAKTLVLFELMNRLKEDAILLNCTAKCVIPGIG